MEKLVLDFNRVFPGGNLSHVRHGPKPTIKRRTKTRSWSGSPWNLASGTEKVLVGHLQNQRKADLLIHPANIYRTMIPLIYFSDKELLSWILYSNLQDCEFTLSRMLGAIQQVYIYLVTRTKTDGNQSPCKPTALFQWGHSGTKESGAPFSGPEVPGR